MIEGGIPVSELNNRTTVTDIDIPFGRLVIIFVKFALAVIPAAIIVWIIMAAIMLTLGSIFGGFGPMMQSMGT